VAVDGRGVPVTDLQPGAFEVWISGYRVPIVDVYAVTPAGTPRTVVLLLDDAAIGPDVGFRVQEAARLFVESMGEGDRLTIALLQKGQIESTDDRTRLLRIIDDYRVQGFPFRIEDAGEHVLRTLESMARRLSEVPDGRPSTTLGAALSSSKGRKAIVAIGAGWLFDTPLPPPSHRDLQREWVSAMRAMASANVTLYVIDPSGMRVNQRPTSGNIGLAHETGGHAFLSTNDIAGAVRRIWAEAGTYYVLAMVNPPVQRTADLREVDVRVLRKDVTVRARRGIKGKD
jgi:VWFA-related protein